MTTVVDRFVTAAFAAALAASSLTAHSTPLLTQQSDEIQVPKTSDLMKGKIRTGRRITLETIVSGSPADIYSLWLSEESVRLFFAPKSHIDAEIGGEYNMIFRPSKYPDGENFGTKGARILRLEPGRAIWFEWNPFVLEDKEAPSSPPTVSPEEYAKRPLPTWVELEFEAVGKGRTRVRLSHEGFGSGAKWDESFVYFSRAWATVMTALNGVADKTAASRKQK